MLQAAMDAGQAWLAALILIGSLVGCVYYGRLIKVLFFSEYTGAPVAELPLTIALRRGRGWPPWPWRAACSRPNGPPWWSQRPPPLFPWPELAPCRTSP